MTSTTLIRADAATHAPLLGAAFACAMDRHLGPYEPVPEMSGWLGADWCHCRRCGSTITRATTLRNAA